MDHAQQLFTRLNRSIKEKSNIIFFIIIMVIIIIIIMTGILNADLHKKNDLKENNLMAAAYLREISGIGDLDAFYGEDYTVSEKKYSSLRIVCYNVNEKNLHESITLCDYAMDYIKKHSEYKIYSLNVECYVKNKDEILSSSNLEENILMHYYITDNSGKVTCFGSEGIIHSDFVFRHSRDYKIYNKFNNSDMLFNNVEKVTIMDCQDFDINILECFPNIKVLQIYQDVGCYSSFTLNGDLITNNEQLEQLLSDYIPENCEVTV